MLHFVPDLKPCKGNKNKNTSPTNEGAPASQPTKERPEDKHKHTYN